MRTLLTCALLLLAVPVFAALGTVTYVAGQGETRITVTAEQFGKPGTATGLTAPLARVANVPFNDGKLSVALDADTADGKQCTRVRLDFTGAAAFTPEHSLELSAAQGDYAFITPKDFSLTMGGRTLPVRIGGYLTYTRKKPSLLLTCGVEAQARCAFGDKTHTVHIIDANGNWRYGDANPVLTLPHRGNIFTGDRVQVDTAEEPAALAAPVWGWYGQPIAVDGQWYQIAISADESTITVTPFTGALGTVSLTAEHWNGIFIGKQYMVDIAGTAQPQTIPADDYHLVSYQDTPDPTAGTAPLVISDYDGKGKVYSVQANADTAINLGPSLTARVEVRQDGRELIFALTATDAEGVPFAHLGNNIPFAVTDQQGNKVYENTFESG